MPLIEDNPIHHSVRHSAPPSGCYDRTWRSVQTYTTFTGEVVVSRFDQACRQIGRKFNGAWVPLDECLGCKAQKDGEYILQARAAIDKEMTRFMKADQRVG